RERRTVPLKRSTADSSIYAGPRWDSATSRITSRGVCSSPVASDRFYTLNYDEPEIFPLVAYVAIRSTDSSFIGLRIPTTSLRVGSQLPRQARQEPTRASNEKGSAPHACVSMPPAIPSDPCQH